MRKRIKTKALRATGLRQLYYVEQSAKRFAASRCPGLHLAKLWLSRVRYRRLHVYAQQKDAETLGVRFRVVSPERWAAIVGGHLDRHNVQRIESNRRRAANDAERARLAKADADRAAVELLGNLFADITSN